jgi:hypothetical protein
MKYGMMGLGTVALITGVLWSVLGGTVLAIIFGSTILVTIILSAFALGSWWSSRLIQQGAAIALKAQGSDDRRDMIQMNALAGLVKETLKIRGSLPVQNQYAALPFRPEATPWGETAFKTDFIIEGLDEEEVQR